MDNYEINILRRNGNWNKITQDDGVMNNNEQIENKNDHTQLDDDFKFYLNEVSSIIKKIEDLEKEKENLKDQLKIYEQEFINKKKDTEDKINLLTEEREILDKTINVMKNLKSI
jgi:molecular chaperone GrpE (heat shock protein)